MSTTTLYEWFTLLYLCSCSGSIPVMAPPQRVTIIRVSICFSQWTVSFSRAGTISPSSVNFLSPPMAKGRVGAHVHIYSSHRWLIAVAPVVSLRFLACSVRSGLCRNPVQKAIWCASQSSSPVGWLVWMWCDDHAAQRPWLCSQAQNCLLSHAHLAVAWVLVQGWRRPNSPAVSFEISAAVFNSWPQLSLGSLRIWLNQLEMRLWRQIPLGRERLSFGSLYLIQREIMSSQLHSPAYQANLRSFSGQRYNGLWKCNLLPRRRQTVSGTKSKDKGIGEAINCLFFIWENRKEYLRFSKREYGSMILFGKMSFAFESWCWASVSLKALGALKFRYLFSSPSSS